MALNFTTTSEASVNTKRTVAIYGGAGTGKTMLCATAPNPLIISAEKGLLSLSKFDIPAIEIETWDDMLEVYEFLTSDDADAVEWLEEIDTICYDSITEIAERIVEEAKPHVKDARQAYGDMHDRIIAHLKQIRNVLTERFNIVLIFKQEQVKDEEFKRLLYRPMMPGQAVAPQIPHLFDEVLCLRIGKDKKKKTYRFLQTGKDLNYDAKDRSGELAEFEEPDLTLIFNKILGEE